MARKAARCDVMRCDAKRCEAPAEWTRVECTVVATRDWRFGTIAAARRPTRSSARRVLSLVRLAERARSFVRSSSSLVSPKLSAAPFRPVPSRPVAACHRTASATARRLICGDGPFALIGSAHRFSSPFVSSPLVPSSRLGFGFTHFVVSVSFALRVASPSPLRCCATRADPSRADPIQCDCEA